MKPGVAYKCNRLEYRGKNDQGKPMSVVTLETKDGVESYYAPASLYWELNRWKQTSYIMYDGLRNSTSGYQYPVFKFAN